MKSWEISWTQHRITWNELRLSVLFIFFNESLKPYRGILIKTAKGLFMRNNDFRTFKGAFSELKNAYQVKKHERISHILVMRMHLMPVNDTDE